MFGRFSVVVENPAGSVRTWKDAAGTAGETKMLHDYGYLEEQDAPDGDELDCYLGPDPDAKFVHVVHQLRAPDFTGWDEDKVMLGFADEAGAKAAYLAHRNDGERAYGGMSSMPVERFLAKMARRGAGKIRHSVFAEFSAAFDTYEEALAEAKQRANASKIDYAVRKVNEYGKTRFAVSAASSSDSDYARAEIVRPGSFAATDPQAENLARLQSVATSSRAATADAAGLATQRSEETDTLAAALQGSRAAYSTFQALGVDGKVRSGVWDRICVPGEDYKDGQSTEFTLETLSEMVDNFARRGDAIPIDHDHQSNYAPRNGRPAPALGFYGAFAVVWGGQIIKTAAARGVEIQADYQGLDRGLPGLWALRSKVTPLGEELLPNYQYLSPTFTPRGTTRDGTPVGYMLAAVAATNVPWQPGTQITFDGRGATEPVAKPGAFAREFAKPGAFAREFAKPGAFAREFADHYKIGGFVIPKTAGEALPANHPGATCGCQSCRGKYGYQPPAGDTRPRCSSCGTLRRSSETECSTCGSRLGAFAREFADGKIACYDRSAPGADRAH